MEAISLKALVRAKYESIQNFATALGWKYGKTYRLLQQPGTMSIDDAKAMKELLGIDSLDSFLSFIF